MTKWKEMLPYLAATAAAFYLLPLWMKNTGAAMALLLAVLPAVCFGAAALFGCKKGGSLWYGAAVCLLFVPTLFLFYNSSAWVYALAYGLLALAGSRAGKAAARLGKGK